MTKQHIDVGSGLFTGDGEDIRDAFVKINENFTELYNSGTGNVNDGVVGFSGSVGFAGSQGIQGFSGSRGIIGFTGSQGIQGFAGSQGTAGVDGSQGTAGFTGSQGTAGVDGSQGIQGIIGFAGSQGIQGFAGLQGIQGFAGSQGIQGFAGSQGIQGIQGVTGFAGSQGTAGFTGSQGTDGSTGAQGAPGVKGDKGDTGAQGVSVTLQGTKSTIADLPAAPLDPNTFAGHGWIVATGDGNTHLDGSLWFWNLIDSTWNDIGPIVGPQGDQGPQGPAGGQGSQGPAGNQGPAGADGAPGTGITGWTVDVNNHLIPNTDNVQDLGTPTNRIRHIYVGPGSITVGSSVITESTTGKLVLPGITRGVNYSIDEVEEKGDQTYSFVRIPVIIDAARYDILQGVLAAPQGYQSPEYEVDDIDDGFIDGISITNDGAGLDQTIASKMRDQMRAYIGADPDPINNFQAVDWVVIPFTVSTEAADIEYENGGGASNLEDLNDVQLDGPSNGQVLTWNNDQEKWENQDPSGASNLGNFKILGSILGTQGENNNDWGSSNINIDPGGESYAYIYLPSVANQNNGQSLQLHSYATETSQIQLFGRGGVQIATTDNGTNQNVFEFDNRGALRLPEGGDILDSNGDSVLGGGNNSYNPDNTDNWNDPTVNTIQAALDELAARVAAIQNFEIDGGNAYTPAAGETIIDGNGA